MRFLVSLALAFALLTAPAVLRAADKTCVIATEADFVMTVTKRSPPPSLYLLTQVGRDKLLTFINGIRAKQKQFPLEADKVMLGMLTQHVGIVMFKDGCVVPGTIVMLNAVDFMTLVKASGLKLEDKTPYVAGLAPV